MAPPKTGVPPTPKKSGEAKVRRVSQIGRLLVGELSEVGPDGAMIDIGQAWKGFIPAPMFAWHPRDEGAGEASTSGREGGGDGSVPRKGSEEEVLRKGFSKEVARTREELERTLYGVKLKVSVRDSCMFWWAVLQSVVWISGREVGAGSLFAGRLQVKVA
jgi:hypothetical protein